MLYFSIHIIVIFLFVCNYSTNGFAKFGLKSYRSSSRSAHFLSHVDLSDKNEMLPKSRTRALMMDLISLSSNIPKTNITLPLRRFGMSKNLRQRWTTGLSLGAIATLWIFSGNGYFTLGFLIGSVLAQMEYYNMVKNTGVEPATKTGLLSSLLCYTVAAMAPQYHELVLPFSATFLMIWLLVFKKKASSISEISTTFLGMFYVGYLPSFWVRLRALGEMTPTLFPVILQRWGWTRADTWTKGAIVTWWTWTSIVFADVGAYFGGKNFGRHKLSSISSAAGATSPNKTVEGAISGFLSCMVFSVLGAYLMQWPLWVFTGALYGLLLSVIAFVGDLTASMMKRDAGMKDSGNILPGHGGVLDRIDSYMFTAPVAYLFCTVILSLAEKFDGSGRGRMHLISLVTR